MAEAARPGYVAKSHLEFRRHATTLVLDAPQTTCHAVGGLTPPHVCTREAPRVHHDEAGL